MGNLRISKQLSKEYGSCNFCTRLTERRVWVIIGNDKNRNLEVRFCNKCFDELRKAKSL